MGPDPGQHMCVCGGGGAEIDLRCLPGLLSPLHFGTGFLIGPRAWSFG